MSRRTALSRPWFSSWPVADWNRRLNSSALAFLSSSVRRSLSKPSSASMERFFEPIAILTHHLREPRYGPRSEERRVGKECRARWAPVRENREERGGGRAEDGGLPAAR